MTLSAVLWDMDGTLVDTEPYWIEAEFEVVASHGNGAWSQAHAHALVGMDLRDAARYMAQHGDVRLGIDEIVHRLLDGVIDRVRQRVPWRPGARALLEELQAEGIPSALVTMSWRRFTEAVLAHLPEGAFREVVAGDDVRRGKPHPEPYLMGAARLGVRPEQCIAVEDSPTGARSAQDAGCVVLAVPNVVPLPEGLGHYRRDTLEGLGTADLRDMHRRHHATRVPERG
jgi:HAD superfamily hydrolase (TIGR01509 family)